MKASCRNCYLCMHKTAIFLLLNIEVVFISAFLTNMNTNKYFVVVGGCSWLVLSYCFRHSEFNKSTCDLVVIRTGTV